VAALKTVTDTPGPVMIEIQAPNYAQSG
jgi:hypothetical protein